MLTQVNIKIKIIFIIVIKLDSRVDAGQNPSHKSGGSIRLTQVNIRIKVVMIIVLKLDSGFDLGKTRFTGREVNPGQCKDKNGYYYSFKIQLRSQLG